MMTVKDFFVGFFYLPAKTLSGIADLLFGSYIRKDDGRIQPKAKVKSNTRPGLLGYLFSSIKYIAINISDFIYRHQTIIAATFWVSLFCAAVMALTIAFWPLALSTLAGLSIFGVSIASLAANPLAQVGIIAAFTFLAASVGSYIIAGIVKTIEWLANCCAKPQENNDDSDSSDDDEDHDRYDPNGSHRKMKGKLGDSINPTDNKPADPVKKEVKAATKGAANDDKPVETEEIDAPPADFAATNG